jgi:3-methylcrotonyl-CoA carboxylase alpha subunit
VERLTRPRPVSAAVVPSARLEGDPVRRIDPDTSAEVAWLDAEHAILSDEEAVGAGPGATGSRLWIGPARPGRDGMTVREVVVDGWSIEVEVEDLARAELRRRATRGTEEVRDGGAIQVRAELPGRIASVGVALGDLVEAGQALLVIEAMKMLNDVRAPRAGVVQALAVSEGGTVERGSLLVTLG